MCQVGLCVHQIFWINVWLQAETRRKSLIMIPRYQRFKVVNSIPIKTELGPYLGYMGYYLSNGGRISFIFDV